MPIEVRHHGPVKVVRLIGEFTVGRQLAKPVDLQGRPVDDLSETLTALLDGGFNQIVLDLSLVTFIDSAGLGELVASKKRTAERGGDIKLLSPARRVHELLAMTLLTRVFEIYRSEDDAIASFNT
ncbi:MAG: STAS domain-containing protein [Acidobacteriota bacterium]|jgi:anti-sigma B factor antagonist